MRISDFTNQELPTKFA